MAKISVLSLSLLALFGGWEIYESYMRIGRPSFAREIAWDIACLVCVLLGMWLAYRLWVLRPIQFLTRATRRVSQWDLDYRVGYKSKDELGELASAFDRMSEMLAGNVREIEDQASELREWREDMAAIQQAAQRFARELDSAELASIALRVGLDAMEADRCGVLTVGQDGRHATLVSLAAGAGHEKVDNWEPPRPLRQDTGLEDLAAWSAWAELVMGQEEAGTLMTPVVAQGHILGAYVVARGDDRPFSMKERGVFAILADNLSIAMQNARSFQMAITDPLTGLFTRRYMEERLDQELARAARLGTPVSVMLLDLNGFKRANDQFGHLVGDAVLEQFANVLRRQTRASDTPVRFGGDEFVVIMPDTDGKGATGVAARVIRGMDEDAAIPQLRGGEKLTLSIGIASVPEHANNKRDLLALADAAMYAAKRQREESNVALAEPGSPAAA